MIPSATDAAPLAGKQVVERPALREQAGKPRAAVRGDLHRDADARQAARGAIDDYADDLVARHASSTSL